MSLLDMFDGESAPILTPEDIVSPVEGFPETVIGIFSRSIVDSLAERANAECVAYVDGIIGKRPVWRLSYKGLDIGLTSMPLGGPAAALQLEDMAVMGAKRFVVFGCCGVLRQDIAENHIIVPTSAVRDEGTSYHYIPASDEIALDALGVAALTSALEALEIPFVAGKVWTTDALYRETRLKIESRQAMGCIAVDMECASMAAVAEYRGYRFAQFLFAADNLDAEEWEARSLADMGKLTGDMHMAIALETALRL